MLGSAGYVSKLYLGASDPSLVLAAVVPEGAAGVIGSVAAGAVETGAAVAGVGGSVTGTAVLDSVLSSMTGLGAGITVSIGASVF